LGGYKLTAAGRQESDGETAKSAYLELVGRDVAGMAKDLSARVEDEIVLGQSEEVSGATDSLASALIRLRLPEGTVEIAAGLDSPLIAGLSSGLLSSRLRGTMLPFPAPKNFDLLLDVEMPVSVSFGRAHMPLKDVLKPPAQSSSWTALFRSLWK